MKDQHLFKKVIVALDLSLIDEALIRYSRFITDIAGTEVIRFVHFIPPFNFPDPITMSFEEMVKGEEEPIEKRVEHQLAQEVQALFDDAKGVDVQVDAAVGNPQQQLIKVAQKDKPNLIIVGKKSMEDSTGIIARRLARKTSCAIALVPEKAPTDMKNVLVPTDFSKASARALKAALHLKEKHASIEISVFHAVPLPSTAYSVSEQKSTLEKALLEEAKKSMTDFLKKNKIDQSEVHITILINEHFDVAKHIREEMVTEPFDLVIVGATGQSVFEDFVFGSVTESLVTYEMKVPVWVVR